jgi:hypothetical protein
MKGAIVFIVVFAIVLVISLGSTAIPPGKAIYNLAFPNTEDVVSGYLVGGAIDGVTAIVSIINGVIFGFVAWVVYGLAATAFRRNKKNTVQQAANTKSNE